MLLLRSANLKDKPFFTPQEAAQWESEFTRRTKNPHEGNYSLSNMLRGFRAAERKQ